jgi:hypothetical protein
LVVKNAIKSGRIRFQSHFHAGNRGSNPLGAPPRLRPVKK